MLKFAIIFLILFSASFAQEDSYIKKVNGRIVLPEEKARPVVIPKFSTVPTIDGILDDEAWKEAAVFKDFYQTSPGDNIMPSKPTVVYMGYDEKNIYIAFECFDEKEKIRASFAKRDDVFGEDNVRIWLDTYNDQRRAYVLGFNPFGIQQDGIYVEGKGIDYSVDILMESKGTIHSWGWAVEVRIPFSSLRYEAGKGKLWGFNVARNIDRFNDEFDEWMPIDRNVSGRLIQHGKITGFEEIQEERTIEILPSFTIRKNEKRVKVPDNPTGKLKNEPLDHTLGLTLKYSIASNLTFDLTINPDFAEIEADAPVVTANQRFPLYFPEKRPFFLEGYEIFQLPIQTFYSRTIIAPEIAAKLTGKKGKHSFSFLTASDKGPGTYSQEERNDPALRARIEEFLDKRAFFSIFRLKTDVRKEDSVGFFGSYRSFPEQKNLLLSVDGRFKLNPTDVFQFQLVGTHSKRCFFDPYFEPALDELQAKRNREICSGNTYQTYRNGNGLAYLFSIDRTEETKGFFVELGGRSKDYRADAGFTRRTNTNYLFGMFRLSTKSKPKKKIIKASWLNDLNFDYDWQGRLQNVSLGTAFDLSFQGNASLRLEAEVGYERLYEEEFGLRRMPSRPLSGAFWETPERSAAQNSFSFRFTKQFGEKLNFGASSSIVFNDFDFDFGVLPRFPRVSPAASAGSDKLDPGKATRYNFSSSLGLKPNDSLRISLNYSVESLFRKDTKKKAFDSQILTLNTTYQFTKFIFAKGRIDYYSVSSNFKTQFLFGWTPAPGKALYLGYNDDFNYNGFNPFSWQIESGFKRNFRSLFFRTTYLIRHNL
ncbi:MAG: carbohydrate binding family 9 domain-containing protein [Pyrinomonadaceae bacterium]|nr:carbohydrate binding family 9 domain-containing protein [Pyrinomonadaceae bacterium]MCX7640305.1 carbohydrate binding family 9 domain-containing protein [Pyrinomonadaceae bacterium]MDW8303379.1 DUF5916 domain-containing protein [Acidobacteriota bacterium]